MEDLLKILTHASSQNVEEFEPAVKLLKQAESFPNFHIYLLQIGLSFDSVDTKVRFLAVLHLKNGIERNWRTPGPTRISDEEKAIIRKNILQCLNEKIPQIALQFAVITSKVARYDYPSIWSDLFENLFHQLLPGDSNSFSLKYSTVLLILHYSFKELSSKKLSVHRKQFTEIARAYYSQCFSLWESYFGLTCLALSKMESNADVMIENLTIMLKILRTIFPVLDDENTQSFLEMMLRCLEKLLSFIEGNDRFPLKTKGLFYKLLTLHSKIFLIATEMNKFKKGGTHLVNICKKCVNAYSTNRSLFDERFIVNLMNCIKALVSRENNNEVKLQSDDMQEMMNCLVFSYLRLSNDDLMMWENDVEEFCCEEIGETYKYNLRPCTQVLFLTFLHKDPSTLVPVILSTLNTANSITKQDMDLDNALKVDAVYSATGLAVWELFDSINFESWFIDDLLPCVQRCQQKSFGKLIHRRVLRLVDEWMGAAPPMGIKIQLYEFITTSLSVEYDLAVRLTAASTLRQVLDEIEFELEIDKFTPFQDQCTECLYKLLEDTELGDSKMRVLHVLSFLIERLGPNVVHSSAKLFVVLPAIWADSEAHNMLRCAVVTLLDNLVNGLKQNWVGLSEFVFNVIYTSTDVSSPEHVYLLQEGLLLWISVLHNSQQNDGLLHLFNSLPSLLEQSTESIRECLDIVEGYTVLYGGNLWSSSQGIGLANCLMGVCTDVRDECLVIVTRLVDLMLQICPTETIAVFQPYIQDCFQRVLNEGPTGVLAATCMVLSARLVVNASEGFFGFVNRLAGNQDAFKVIQELLIIFSDRIDTIVDTEQRKLLALASLLLLRKIEFNRDSLHPVFCLCAQVLHDVCDENFSEDSTINSADDDSLLFEHEHSRRKVTCLSRDAVRTVSLPHFFREQIEFIRSCGTENFQALLESSVDPDILSQLRPLLC